MNTLHKLLKKKPEENDLRNSPHRFSNCHEIFPPLVGMRKKADNLKYAYAQAHGISEHFTLLCGASAVRIAPMIMYPKSFPGGAYTFKGPDDAVHAKSESGWVDSEIFLSWKKKVFLEFASSTASCHVVCSWSQKSPHARVNRLGL